MTPPRLHKVEEKESRIKKFIVFLNSKLHIIAIIFLMVLFFAICFTIKGPTYGWFGS